MEYAFGSPHSLLTADSQKNSRTSSNNITKILFVSNNNSKGILSLRFSNLFIQNSVSNSQISFSPIILLQ